MSSHIEGRDIDEFPPEGFLSIRLCAQTHANGSYLSTNTENIFTREQFYVHNKMPVVEDFYVL